MQRINSILIANRGEIASRIIRTCKRMGIRTIAVYADPDKEAPFVSHADLAVHLPGTDLSATYLNTEKLLEAANRTGAQAIHPGYGFLSENAGFARACAEAGLIFIGPNPEAIDAMGSKSEAKKLMRSHKVPVIPGYEGKDQSVKNLVKAATEIGFPVLLKAAAGGGGKGMRRVNSADQLEAGIEAAKREAKNAFGNDELIIEKYFDAARHIEFQIFGDQHGNALHLLERECSLQRRYQKIWEESPSPVLTLEKRKAMGDAAVRAAKALNYDNAGTVEFIYTDEGDFYFLEVNTRLQVEHGVTERITGLDLVEMQIHSAEGHPLTLKQEDITANGYALELRLYAEDPELDFQPASGTVLHWEVPEQPAVRVDTAVKSGSVVSPFYDPMIAKFIHWDTHRHNTLRGMHYFLQRLLCVGLTTNQDFLLKLLENEGVQKGEYHTKFIESHPELFGTPALAPEKKHLLAAATTLWLSQQRNQQRTVLHALPSGWRNSFYQYQQETLIAGEEEVKVEYRHTSPGYQIRIDTGEYTASEVAATPDSLQMNWNGVRYTLRIFRDRQHLYIHHPGLGTHTLALKDRFPVKQSDAESGGYIAPMPAQVVKVMVEPGQSVEAEAPLVVLSSMKMENTIVAEEAGTIAEVFVEAGQNIEAGTVLLTFKEEEKP